MDRIMRLVSTTLIAVLIIVPITHADTTSGDVADYIERGEYRSYFDKTTELPSGIAFNSLVGLVDATEVRAGRDDALLLVSHFSDLDNAKATDLLEKLLVVQVQMASAEKGLTSEALCYQGISKVYGDDAYAALEAVDDGRTAIYEQAYIVFISRLDAEQAASFRNWVNESKSSIVHVDLDYRKIHGRKGSSADTLVASICSANPGK